MAQSIESVQLDITASAKGASQMLQLLERRLEGVQSALKAIDTSSLKSVSNATKSLGVNTSGLTKDEQTVRDSVDRIKQALAGLNSYRTAALSGDTSSLTSFDRKAIKIQSDIDVLGEKLRQLNDQRVDTNISTDKVQAYRDELAQVQAALKLTKTDVSMAVSTMNSQQPKVDEGGETKARLEEISSSAKKAASSMLSMAGKGIRNSISSLRSHLSKIKDTLSSIGSSSSKGVTSAFSKILKYGFGIRSLYVLFRRLKQAIKDSFTELQKSGADFQTTKANVEALKNSLTTLKYQFGAAFEPIFNTVAPALQTLINYLVSVMNTLSAFIAKLSGKSTYSKAVVATGEIAKNTGSAAGSAKELNKQLQGFDELNNLSGDSGSGGGGSGGSSSDASNVTYEEADVNGALSSFWSSLAESIEAGDWRSVGSKISEKLTSAMNDIKWDDIYKKASDFGTNLANFLNGLITTDLFSALGTTIAGSLNTALSSLNSFGETFDWTNLGNSIASGINSFVTTFDLNLAVDTFNKWANGILDALISAVGGVDFKNIATKVSDGIEKIDASGIGWKLGKLVDSLVDALYDLLSNKNTWTNLGTKIADGINGFFEGFDGSSLAKTANAIKDALFDTVKTAVKNISWTEIGNDITSFLGDLDIGTIALAITGVMLASGAATNLVSWATAAIVGKLSALTMATMGVSLGTLAINVAGVVIAAGAAFKIGWDIGTTFGEWFAAHLKDAGLITDSANEEYYQIAESMTMMEKINDIKLSIQEGTFTRAWQEMCNDWYEPYNQEIVEIAVKIKNIALELVDGWNNTNDKIWDPVFELGEDIWEGIKDAFTKVIDWASPIKDMFDNIVQKIKDKFGIHSPAESMKTYGEQIFNGIIEGFKSMFSGDSIKNMISTLYTNIVNKIKDKFKDFKLSSIVQGLGDFAVSVKSTFTGAITKFSDWSKLDTTLSDLKTKYKDMKAKLTTTLSGAATKLSGITEIKDKFKDLTDTWKDKASELKTKVGGELKKIGDLDSWKTKFTNLYDSWKGNSSTFSAKTGGDIKKIDDLSVGNSSWKSKIGNLKSAWTGQEAKFIASESTDNVYNSIFTGAFKNIKDNWKGKTADFDTFFKKDNTGSAWKACSSNGDLGSLAGNWTTWSRTTAFDTVFKKTNDDSAWKACNKNGDLGTLASNWTTWSRQTNFTTFFKKNNDDSAWKACSKNGDLGSLAGNWTTWARQTNFTTFFKKNNDDSAWMACSKNGDLGSLAGNWTTWGRTASFGASVDYNSFDTAKSELESYKSEWAKNGSKATFSANISYNENDLSKSIKSMTEYIQTQLNGITLKVKVSTTNQESVDKALGGSYYGGSWHNIPQYAKGGKPNYGTMFIAGEAGPEIVGHLNGRTEVLNKSQIASTIHSAFVSSMAQFGNRMLATPESVAIQSGSYSAYNSSMNDGQTALLAEQNRLLAEQNQLLMEIASKDVSISSRDVFNAVKSESKRYNNMTGSSPFLF